MDEPCPRCGQAFPCQPQGACWCMRLEHRLPLPAPQEENPRCLCPACLAAALPQSPQG